MRTFPPKRTPDIKEDWLLRSLKRSGMLPPYETEAAIKQGRVRVNGKIQLLSMAPLRKGDQVTLDRKPVDLSPPTLVLMFHKPFGAVTSNREEKDGETVFSLLSAKLPRDLVNVGWHAVGRLDRNTTGLLLFTNDERVVAHVTSPETHLEKRYRVEVGGHLTDEALEPIRRGIELHDGEARPARVVICGLHQLQLTLTEGRNHQAKRMLGAVGLPALKLHREAIGTLELDIPVGEWRRLTETEITKGLRWAALPPA